jgi:hypothetical protein
MPGATIPLAVRILAIALRALFSGALVAVTVGVSSPQSESLASVHETLGDLIRLALGFAVCLWISIHLFMPPRTAEGPPAAGDVRNMAIVVSDRPALDGNGRFARRLHYGAGQIFLCF